MDTSTADQTSFETLDVSTHDGLRLFARRWVAAVPAKATVVHVHGFGEHSGRHDHIAGWVVEAGMNSITYDLRGHGRSEGAPGHYKHFSDLVADLIRVLEVVEGPCFVWAHSFGGQVLLRAGLERKLPILAAFVSSPWLHLAFEPPAWRVALAGVMSVVWPTFTQSTTLNAERLSRDMEFLKSLPNPEFAHRRISARAYFECVKSGEFVLNHAAQWKLPLCLAQGDQDPVTSLPTNRRFFERCGAEDKKLVVFPEFRHEIHNEFGREQVRDLALSWFEAHLPSA